MFALILTVCVMAGNTDKCDDYVIDAFPTITECLTALDDATRTQPLPDDRYRSCGFIRNDEYREVAK